MRAPILTALILLAPLGARAQYTIAGPDGEPSEAAIAQARDLYQQAGAELEAGRWADAAELFERSYRLSGVPSALFNHATALRSLGRHRDARDAFALLLRDHPDLDAERRAEAEARMREEAGRVALVLVTGLRDAPDARLTFDGAPVPALEHPVEIETDSGEHAVGVVREGFEPFRAELSLADGERETVDVTLVELAGENLAESPVLWTIVAIVIVGGAVAGGVVGYELSQHQPAPPFDMNVVEL